MNEPILPHAIFGARLRAARSARKLSHDRLARAMSAAGRPISKASLIRLEQGDRDPTLDEALALAWYFSASLTAWLLPGEEQELQVSGHDSLDADVAGDWLRYGLGTRELWRARLAEEVGTIIAEQARAYTEAYVAGDKAGMKKAGATIVRTMKRYEAAHARFVDSPNRAYGWDGLPIAGES